MSRSKQTLFPVEFGIGPRFDVFYALETLSDPSSRIHADWKERALEKLQTHSSFRKLTGARIWSALSDALEVQPVDLSFDSMVKELRLMPIEKFQTRVLEGQLHDARITEALVRGRLSLEEAFARVTRTKREWLAFIGLYPWDPAAPLVRELQALIRDPHGYRSSVLERLEIFWREVFAETWQKTLVPELKRSLEDKERSYAMLPLPEFAQETLLRVLVDEKKQCLAALRGGYELPFSRIERCVFTPSAFNDRRYWTAFELPDGRKRAYFPYFDPQLSLGGSRVSSEPELDPSLIFKALADPTRFALVKLLFDRPRSSVELAKQLLVSKPTVSHHVSQLREAGLLREQYRSGSVELSVRNETLEGLSGLVLRKLSDNAAETKRRK